VGKIRPISHEDELSLVEHLDELRTRLIVLISAFVIVGGICFWQNHEILKIVNDPLPDGKVPWHGTDHAICHHEAAAQDASGQPLRAAGPGGAHAG